jgi:hypothetical protein
MKGERDEIADGEDDDDVVRTSVSQDRVTAALCTEELFLSTQYTVYRSPCISDGQPCGRGRIRMVNMRCLVGPAGSYTSQPPDLTVGYRVSDKTGYLCTIIL